MRRSSLREAVRLGLTEGPHILTCGRIISATAPGGRIFRSMYREADGPGRCGTAVREQHRRGADYIKVMATGARSVAGEDPEPAQLTREELEAVVDEAHRLGLRVAAHAEGLDGARLAVEVGVETIEHGLSLHREPALLERMASRASRSCRPSRRSTTWPIDSPATSRRGSSSRRSASSMRRTATVRAARSAGVTLAMGYDSGPPGASARELVRLTGAGLSAGEAIVAATAGSAAALGSSDRGIGRARRGRRPARRGR